MFKKRGALCACVLVGAMALAACGSSSSSTSSQAASGANAVASGASNNSTSSSQVGGQLIVYSNSGQQFIQPVLNAFEKAYPKVRLSYSDLDDPVSFARYRAEHAQGARTADVIIASSPSLWVQNKDVALNWTPVDPSEYPSFRVQFPGVFVLSPDPTVSIYSKVKLPGKYVADTYPQLEANVKQNPALLDHKLVTYTANNFFGYSAFWGYVQKYGWSALNTLGAQSSAFSDGVALAQSVATGAAIYGYFESGLIRGALTPVQQKLVGWLYMRDFTPLISRGIAVTKGAANPAAAKAFVNWLYSQPGQQVLCGAGFTAYRTGVNCPFSLSAVERAVGASHVFLVPYSTTIAQDRAGFVQHWQQLYH